MLKLNTHRTFSQAVTVAFIGDDGSSQKGEFGATFKIMPTKELLDDKNFEKRMLDLVLVSVEETDLDIRDADDHKLSGDELIEALKSDPTVANALIEAYNAGVTKKGKKRI